MKKWIFIIPLLLIGLTTHAQFEKLLGPTGNRRSIDKPPATISADHFLVQVNEKIVTYEGNVLVDDTDVVIKCHKLNLIGKDKDTQLIINKSTEKKDNNDQGVQLDMFGDLGGSIELDRIEFEEDLVMIRKQKDKTGQFVETQRATAGHGVYHAKEGKFVLTQKPKVTIGKNTLEGEELAVYRENMQVTGKKIVTKIQMEQKPEITENKSGVKEEIFREKRK